MAFLAPLKRCQWVVYSKQPFGGPGAVLAYLSRYTHRIAISNRRLYEAFEPAEARRIIERFEWHYTPKHGSWLNLAESELGVLSGQCLARRIADATMLTTEVDAWRSCRNMHNAKANWHFTSTDARVKLKSLYPSL